MTGLPAGFSVELYLGGSWVDVTAWHVGETSTRIHQGRSSEYGDVGPGIASFQLRNEDGRFTPRSTASPYYPDVVPGVRVRVRVTVGATTHDVYTGRIVSWEPSWPNRGQLSGGVVQVSAVDDLAELAGTTLDDRWTEEARVLARTASTWVDIPELAGDSSAAGLDNLGLTGGASTALGTTVVETNGTGGLSYGSPTGLSLARSVSFAPANGAGQIVALTVQDDPGVIDFWLSVPDTDLARYQCVHTLYNGATAIGSLWLEPNAGPGLDLTVRTGTTTVTHTLVVDVQDAAWRHITLRPNGTPTSTDITVATATSTTTVTAAWDMRPATVLRWGARVGYNFGATCQVAGIVATGGSAGMTTARGLVGNTEPVSVTYAALQSYVSSGITWATDGAEDRTIGEPSWYGHTAAQVLQQLARTVNGIAWCRGDGAVTLVMADVARPATPAATLDVEGDLDAASTPPTFRDASDSQPTRVRITYATGVVTAVDTVAEAAGRPRVETEIDTCAADQTAALFAGDYVLTASDSLRVSQVAVDAYSTVTDHWATLLGLFPTQMLRTSGWPLPMAGVADIDVHVQGWDLDISEAAWRYTFDCSPAGLFPGAAWDAGDEYGRWAWTGATVTSGTAVGGTGNGTLIIAFTGAGLTLDPAMYPLHLDWDGEAVEISAPPGGASSPQTVTTTTRGALGTAAQVHLAGEAVDIRLAALWAF